MFNGLLLLTGVLFLAEWFAVASEQKKLRRVTKPAALMALLAWFTQQGLWQDWLFWFGLGLVFSLAGDILLLLPVLLFPAGALAFLLAHIAYIIGLNQTLPVLEWQSLLVMVFAAALAVILGRKFFRSLQQSHHSRRLKALIAVYVIGISVMLISALLTPLRPGWPLAAAGFTMVGAGLFFISDSILAWNKFIRPIRHGNLLVMVCYLLGQLGIVTGALLAHGGV